MPLCSLVIMSGQLKKKKKKRDQLSAKRNRLIKTKLFYLVETAQMFRKKTYLNNKISFSRCISEPYMWDDCVSNTS